MKKETYVKLMNKRFEQVEKQWIKMVNLTNDFMDKNPDLTLESLQSFPVIESNIDGFAFKCSWLYDRLNHIPYRGRNSMSNKIRKALGFTSYHVWK